MAVSVGCSRGNDNNMPTAEGTKPPATATVPADRRYLIERVDEAAVVQLYADGFETLPLPEKTLIWHLYQAALAGRDIFYDQRYAHNLEMRDVLEEIITQKYIANFLKTEVWNDWRRTGYPRLSIVEGAMITGIPQRLRAPATEVAANALNVAATGISIGLEGMLTKVWWASQGPQ